MFRGLGSWLGLESEPENKADTQSTETNREEVGEELGSKEPSRVQEETGEEHEQEEGPEDVIVRQAKGLGSYLFNFASVATKKISESVSETAQTIKKSVEEGKIDGIIDKTIIGDFQKEQEKFVQEKSRKTEAAVPPWVGYSEEETIQQQILALSADRRNFLRDPPAGVHFIFDFEQMYPVALVMLQEDELLNRMRFDLVPKLVKEEVFWRNYFYRVSLIKQSAQLTALAAQQQASEKTDKANARQHDGDLEETVRPKTPPVAIKSPLKNQEEEEEISTSPGVSEFVSDAFDPSNLNQEDLRKGMEQLVLDKKDELDTAEESEDWIKELQEVVQEYEVVADSDKLKDDNWDKEIEELLQED
ncbi:synapse-associated protein 1 isoform 2-T2 [Discoglossus pictus]